MLEYLVTSKARKRLLRLLWAEEARAPVLRLAERGGLSYRIAHKELNEMLHAGLARCSRVGNATVFEANSDHPQAELLRSLVVEAKSAPGRRAGREEAEAQRARSWLAHLGAPLLANPAAGERPTLESLLVLGARLARSDVSVARGMPVFVWQHRRNLDFSLLFREARRLGEKRAVGFFLALAGTLGADSSLLRAAEQLRDRRVKKTEDFFEREHSSVEKLLAEARTPPVAREWLFRMNMTMETFASTFARFIPDASI